MQIKFGLNHSPKVAIKKTVTWPAWGTKTGSLVDGTSILDPQILVEAGADAFTGINYFYIPAFGRYYFIAGNGIETVRTGVVRITGHVDVLTSFASDIGNNEAIFKNLQQRNSALGYNKYINDGTFKVYQDRYIINKYEFPNGFDHSEYVLAMAGS